jgi:hypothetical protein
LCAFNADAYPARGFEQKRQEPDQMNRSRYDELHDKYHSILSTKAGTRYERLTDIVFKGLEESDVTIHDLRLLGESGVEHQIDVILEERGERRRILIECKDFDISARPIGLDTMEKFSAVVSDLKPNDAIIVSCTGFTAPARQFGKAKGIKLVVIRLLMEADWENRVRTIFIRLDVVAPGIPHLEIHYLNDNDRAASEAALLAAASNSGQNIVVGNRDREISLHQLVADELNKDCTLDMTSGRQSVEIELRDAILRYPTGTRVPISGIRLDYDVSRTSHDRVVGASGVALLLVSGLRDDDLIVWDRDIQRFAILENGEVALKV